MALDATRHIRQASTDTWLAHGPAAAGAAREVPWSPEDHADVVIVSQTDIVTARQRGRTLARGIGLSAVEQAFVTSAISELTRNMLRFAGSGEISLRTVQNGQQHGLTIVARDAGPGIPDVDRALADGFSTSGGLGLGLPGVRRLMDDFEIESRVGQGTVVTVTKWSNAARHSAA